MGGVDLIFSSELFSYVENWRDLIAVISNNTQFFLISLFIPEDPIGFIKSEEDLVVEVEKYFEIIEWISIRKEKVMIVFGRSYE